MISELKNNLWNNSPDTDLLPSWLNNTTHLDNTTKWMECIRQKIPSLRKKKRKRQEILIKTKTIYICICTKLCNVKSQTKHALITGHIVLAVIAETIILAPYLSVTSLQIILRLGCCRFNSLWPSDAKWRHSSGSTLVQGMACCMTAPSHYLNQYWLLIGKVQWHSSESHFEVRAQVTILYNEFENYIPKDSATAPKAQWVNLRLPDLQMSYSDLTNMIRYQHSSSSNGHQAPCPILICNHKYM